MRNFLDKLNFLKKISRLKLRRQMKKAPIVSRPEETNKYDESIESLDSLIEYAGGWHERKTYGWGDGDWFIEDRGIRWKVLRVGEEEYYLEMIEFSEYDYHGWSRYS